MSRIFSVDREEKGFPPEGDHSSHPHHVQAFSGPGSAHYGQPQHPPPSLPLDERDRISQLYHVQPHNLVPANNKLLVFRSLTGIDQVPVLSKDGFFSPRNAPNVGIYTRVVQAEKAAASRYHIFNILINTCLAVQIVFSAALTAIGAASGPHSAVTAFGAINTIVAGILTYLRGTGLPNREKNVEKAWGQIREYIEQREREFCLENCMLSVEDEIHNIERMYEEVRTQMEVGASDSGGSRGLDKLTSLRPRGNLLSEAKGAAHTGFDAVRGAISGHEAQTEHHFRDELHNIGNRFRNATHQIKDTGDRIKETTDGIRHTGEDLRQTGEQIQQTGENLRDAEVHLSVDVPFLSKQAQTEQPSSPPEKELN
jgi:SMODS and SLOG-associating 2TM effector domain